VLVDFMVIGAQKCGTSSLAGQLAEHPQVCFCSKKEPGYFDRTEDWKATLDEYHKLYSPAAGQICGEASTMYTFIPEWRGTHSRLAAYNPDLKLIYMMRQPVERIISQYSHRLVRETVRERPEIAVFADPAYVNRTRYAVQIRPYLELFGPEKVLLLIFEEYTHDPLRTLGRIAEFLDVRPDAFQSVDLTARHRSAREWYLRNSYRRIRSSTVLQAVASKVPSLMRRAARPYFCNRLEAKPEFSPELKQTLWQLLEDDVAAMEALMGRRLDIWRDGYVEHTYR
jgi:hypothetical protein